MAYLSRVVVNIRLCKANNKLADITTSSLFGQGWFEDGTLYKSLSFVTQAKLLADFATVLHVHVHIYIYTHVRIYRQYHYTNLTVVRVCVCESGRSTEAIRPELKSSLFLFLLIAELGRYTKQPTDTASNGTSRNYYSKPL